MAARAPVTDIDAVRLQPRTTTMPIVTIQITREGTNPGATSVTAEEKAALIKGASQLLLDVLKKPLESTFVVIDEVDTDNWGWGGLPALEYRKKRTAAAS
jgi:4-oxalocrotonate tautomerase